MIKKYLLKAKALKPRLVTSKVNASIERTVLGDGDSVVIDFGTHYVGKVSLKLSYAGSPPDAPVLLKLKLCEHKSEIEEDTSDYHGWISKSWIQEEFIHVDDLPSVLKLERRYALRYVRVEVVSISTKFKLVIDGASIDYTTSANKEVVPCGNSNRLAKIDDVALRTLKNCMQYEFEDGPKRDRRLWLGDLRLQALANYETYKNYDLVKRCLYLFAGTSSKRGDLSACVFTRPKVMADDTFMFDYSLLFIPTLCDYYKATGDEESVLELLPIALKQLEIAREQFEGHVVKDSDKLGWCFIDWSLELNKQCSAQAVYIYCEKSAIELCKLLDIECDELKSDVIDKSEAAINAFYDEEQGLFVSGASHQISYASNIWMCLSGVIGPDEQGKILDRLTITDAVRPVTPYLYHHYVQALLNIGEEELAKELISSYWGGMVDEGADTFWELYNPENPNESPYGSRVVNSYCHAWSCTPSYFIRRYFGGERID